MSRAVFRSSRSGGRGPATSVEPSAARVTLGRRLSFPSCPHLRPSHEEARMLCPPWSPPCSWENFCRRVLFLTVCPQAHLPPSLSEHLQSASPGCQQTSLQFVRPALCGAAPPFRLQPPGPASASSRLPSLCSHSAGHALPCPPGLRLTTSCVLRTPHGCGLMCFCGTVWVLMCLSPDFNILEPRKLIPSTKHSAWHVVDMSGRISAGGWVEAGW